MKKFEGIMIGGIPSHGCSARYWDVTVHYQTEGGNAGSYRASMVAAVDEEEAWGRAEAEARQKRPQLMKIVGGDVAKWKL